MTDVLSCVESIPGIPLRDDLLRSIGAIVESLLRHPYRHPSFDSGKTLKKAASVYQSIKVVSGRISLVKEYRMNYHVIISMGP